MSNELTTTKTLDDLAVRINSDLSRVDDGLVAASVGLAEAKTECKKIGVTFKAYVGKCIPISYHYACQLAKIGESPNPAKAIADRRSVRAKEERDNRAAATKARRAHGHTDTENTEEDVDSQEYDDEAERLRRIRAHMARAQDAIDYAQDDLFGGVKLSAGEWKEVLTIAKKAARACTAYASTLETYYHDTQTE